MTFEFIMPFLNQFYLTLNYWRPQWDGDGWKISDKRWEAYLVDMHGEDLDQSSSEDDPKSAISSIGFLMRFRLSRSSSNLLKQPVSPFAAKLSSRSCLDLAMLLARGLVLLFK
jgi:hypothetical protein